MIPLWFMDDDGKFNFELAAYPLSLISRRFSVIVF